MRSDIILVESNLLYNNISRENPPEFVFNGRKRENCATRYGTVRRILRRCAPFGATLTEDHRPCDDSAVKERLSLNALKLIKTITTLAVR